MTLWDDLHEAVHVADQEGQADESKLSPFIDTLERLAIVSKAVWHDDDCPASFVASINPRDHASSGPCLCSAGPVIAALKLI